MPFSSKKMLILDGASYTENIWELGNYKSVFINNNLILRFKKLFKKWYKIMYNLIVCKSKVYIILFHYWNIILKQ